MKKAVTALIVSGLIVTFVGAAEPGDWSWRFFIGELSVSAGLSYGLAYAGTSFARHDAGDAIAFIVGVTVGSATGVLLVGELFDGPSDNKLITYAVTTAFAAAFPTFRVYDSK